jgi:hypothetical protein
MRVSNDAEEMWEANPDMGNLYEALYGLGGAAAGMAGGCK